MCVRTCGVLRARPDRNDVVMGLEYVAVAGQQEGEVLVAYDELRLHAKRKKGKGISKQSRCENGIHN